MRNYIHTNPTANPNNNFELFETIANIYPVYLLNFIKINTNETVASHKALLSLLHYEIGCIKS